MTSSETRAHALVVRAKTLHREKVPPGDEQWRNIIRETNELPDEQDRQLVRHHLALLWWGK